MGRTTALLLLICTSAALAAGKAKAPAAAAAAAGTPTAAIGAIPALPKAAGKDLDCSAKEAFEARMQQQMQQDAAAMQAAAMTPMAPQAISDAQAKALHSLNDPEFYSCMTDLQQRPPELWIDAQREKLDAKLAAIDAAKAKSDEAWCSAHAHGEGCADDPNSARKFNAQAVAAATQFLKDAQPPYAGYLKEVADCVGTRDRIIATARGGRLGGQFDAMLMGGTQMNWGLVSVVAGAQSTVCGAARDAANRYLEPAQ